jgi:integrase/recombinase XerD
MNAKQLLYKPHSLKLDTWPEYLQHAWHAAFEAKALFAKQGRASKWRTKSAEKTQKGFGIALHWLRSRWGVSLDDFKTNSIEDLFTRDIVAAYVDDLYKINASRTVENRIQELYDALRVMTPHLPENHWGWLKNAWKNLRSRSRSVRNKFSRLKEADQIEALGIKLIQQADAALKRNHRQKEGLTELQRALMYRDGLMIALLIRRPFRISNFFSLTIGKTILFDHNTISFAFDGSEMKNHRAFDVPFPNYLVPAIIRYLKHYRPILLTTSAKADGTQTNRLWVSRDGTALTEGPLRVAIYKRTKAEFGATIPPHWFRDSVVTTLVHDAPASAMISGHVLGHASIDISQKHYNQALMAESTRRNTTLIETMITKPNTATA